jgi:hypothetical protein
MTPFVLRDCARLPAEPEPSSDQVFDRFLQVWTSKRSGVPLVLGIQSEQSKYGETTITATVEGADQSEISSLAFFDTLSSSKYGEQTRMRIVEGVGEQDFFGGSSSQYGETTLTRTQEGVDQSEMTFLLSEPILSEEAF